MICGKEFHVSQLCEEIPACLCFELYLQSGWRAINLYMKCSEH